MRTGILGGTFDPIHIAHLHTAECALDQLGLDRVLIIPAGDPYQKASREVTPARKRLEMCRLAIAGVPGLEVDDREVLRDGPTYTVETLESFPDDEELFLILGSDALAGMRTWHRWEEISELATLAVAPRPGQPLTGVEAEGVLPIAMGLLEVSGTEIRRRASAGEPYRFLVTDPVHRFVEEERLYMKPDEADRVGPSMETEEQS